MSVGGNPCFPCQQGFANSARDMGKEKDEKKPEATKKNGGCIKKLALLLLIGVMAYLGVHIYFL